MLTRSANGVYGVGETIDLLVAFNRAVALSPAANLEPITLEVNSGSCCGCDQEVSELSEISLV